MTDIMLTPYDTGDAVSLSNTVFRKKILPKGTIDYKGRKITFDDAYLNNLANAFTDGAYDQVAAQVADKDNSHTLDPSRFSGECKGLEVTDDGLYGTFELSTEGAKLVKANPKLGVSASIRENYERADGKKYPAAMGHVLMTLDPRITGLGAWTEVSLSGYDPSANVIDLTGASFEGETVAPTGETEKSFDDLTEDEIDNLTPDQLSAFLAQAAEGFTPAVATPAVTPPVADTTTKKETAMAGAGADLGTNKDDAQAIQLANNQVVMDQLAAVRAELATTRFEKERDSFVSSGVPPAMVELARPLLEVAEPMVINLSNDEKVDATDVARKLLGAMAGFVKLGQERGAQFDFSNDIDPDVAKAEQDEEAEFQKKMAAAGL